LKEKTDDCAESIIYALKSRPAAGIIGKNEKRVGVKAIRGADGLGWFGEIETGDNMQAPRLTRNYYKKLPAASA
jgi:hypothetical protein